MPSQTFQGSIDRYFSNDANSSLDWHFRLTLRSELVHLRFAGISALVGLLPCCLVMVYSIWLCIAQTRLRTKFLYAEELIGLPKFSFLVVACMLTLTGSSPVEANDARSEITQGSFSSCVRFSDGVFELECSFNWTNWADNDGYISLGADEIFEGNGYTIDLNGLNDFSGIYFSWSR